MSYLKPGLIEDRRSVRTSLVVLFLVILALAGWIIYDRYGRTGKATTVVPVAPVTIPDLKTSNPAVGAVTNKGPVVIMTKPVVPPKTKAKATPVKRENKPKKRPAEMPVQEVFAEQISLNEERSMPQTSSSSQEKVRPSNREPKSILDGVDDAIPVVAPRNEVTTVVVETRRSRWYGRGYRTAHYSHSNGGGGHYTNPSRTTFTSPQPVYGQYVGPPTNTAPATQTQNTRPVGDTSGAGSGLPEGY